MSKIVAKNNLNTSTWQIDIENLEPRWAHITIGFENGQEVVEFNNLKFKYELRKNENIINSKSYPEENVKYISSNQDYIEIEFLDLEPNTSYELYVWSENNEIISEKTIQFITP